MKPSMKPVRAWAGIFRNKLMTSHPKGKSSVIFFTEEAAKRCYSNVVPIQINFINTIKPKRTKGKGSKSK